MAKLCAFGARPGGDRKAPSLLFDVWMCGRVDDLWFVRACDSAVLVVLGLLCRRVSVVLFAFGVFVSGATLGPMLAVVWLCLVPVLCLRRETGETVRA